MSTSKVGRNDPCPCGSGRKYKNCCEGKAGRLGPGQWAAIAAVALAAALLVFLVVNVLTGKGGRARRCPPGQVWSDAHGHCHAPQ